MNADKRLKGSDLGYRGNGVPDIDTIMRLQRVYAKRVLAEENLSEAVLEKYRRMNELSSKGEGREAGKLAAELAPIFNFKVDDVDWDN